jgi:hypothetical protein
MGPHGEVHDSSSLGVFGQSVKSAQVDIGNLNNQVLPDDRE